MAAVRSRVKERNAKLEAEGKPTMPEASVVKMAEDLLPKLRVAEWLDRAEAAQRQMDHLDLRDLRSVIIAGDDSIVARDETAVALNVELKASLVRRQAEELQLWIEDIDASLGVGRVIRALRLSSQPPKAGVMFPPELARRLGEAETRRSSLTTPPTVDRVLEAAAFSPVRSLVNPTVAPTTISDDLRATVLRLGPRSPQIAALLGVAAAPPSALSPSRCARRDAPMPSASRPGNRAGPTASRVIANRPNASRRASRSDRHGPVEREKPADDQPADGQAGGRVGACSRRPGDSSSRRPSREAEPSGPPARIRSGQRYRRTVDPRRKRLIRFAGA